MANYDSNYAIAQEISARIGTSPIPFDSVYSIALDIYNELGGEPAEFDSVYSILLGILPLVEGGVASKIIDDSVITTAKTWSSSKINSELSSKASVEYVDEQIEAVAGTANSDIEGKSTEDFHFVTVLPQEAEEDEQVVIKGDNADTLYKYVSGAWTEQTPDANILYFDTENEALYSYVTLEHQFAPVSMVNTIVVGSNLNSNAALKAIKTPGVYSVVQRLHSATKGDYIKNWTLTVESVDYDEYERTDSVYQRIQSNYTIQKRTWSSTRATNDGWSSFSTYYAGEIKDSTTSKYYTWSSSKLNTSLAAKADVYETATTADVDAIFNNPRPKEIWYTSSDGNTVAPFNTYSLPTIVSNTYSDGKGVIKFATDVTSIGTSAFVNTKRLTSMAIPNTVTSIGEEAFSGSYIRTVNIPNSVTSIGGSAFSTTKLTTITLPNSINKIPYRCFYYSKLTSIEIPNSVTSIENEAFYNCDLTSVTIPDSVTSIGNEVFYYCNSMASVTIGNSVASIGNDAFYLCKFTSIEIPNSVTNIGNKAFNGCGLLNNITYNGTVAEWNAITKGTNWVYLCPATVVHCSDGDVNI